MIRRLTPYQLFSQFSRTTVLALAIAFAYLWLPADLSARGRDCKALCDETLSFQSYGTGAEDPICTAQCEETGLRCEEEWQLAFACLEGEKLSESCRDEFELAKACSACTAGDVDPEGMDKLLWVDKNSCLPGTPSGAFGDPFCTVHEGIAEAMNLQSQGLGTKVSVCPAIYREGQPVIGPITAPGGSGRIIVESVVVEGAVVSGSDDATGIWNQAEVTVEETIYNQFVASLNLTEPVWGYVNASPTIQYIFDPPLDFPQVQTRVAEVTAQAGVEQFVQQTIPSLDDRLVTLSAYIRPGSTDRFMLEIGRQNGGGATYGFNLPLGSPCPYEATNSTVDGFGLEEAGNGWYRAYVTQSIDNDPTSNVPTQNPVTYARLRLVEPLAGSSAEVFGLQLDHKPLDRFSVTPRTYVETDLQPETLVEKRSETFYLAKETWTHDWGLTAHDAGWGALPPIFRRSEMLFVDHLPMQQELHLADMKPGSFFIDDGIDYGGFNHKQTKSRVPGSCSKAEPCPIYLLPKIGEDPNQLPVDIAERAQLLWLGQIQNAEVRGFRFQHATAAYDSVEAGCASNLALCPSSVVPAAVSFTNAKDFTLLENQFVYNASFGYSVGGLGPNQDADLLLQGNSSTDNGIGGGGVGATRSISVLDEELSRNNTRGRRSLIQGHSTTGAKYGGVSYGFISGLVAADNYATGLWFDHENHGIEITNSLFSNNEGAGLYFEANDIAPAPSSTNFVLNNLFEGNEVGVQAIGSRNTRVDSNLFENNDFALSLNGNPWTPLPPLPDKWLRDLYVTYNTFDAQCSGQFWMRYGDAVWPSYSRWQPVMESMLSDYNDYSHVDGPLAKGFRLVDIDLSLAEWQGCTTESWCFLPQDGTSSFLP